MEMPKRLDGDMPYCHAVSHLRAPAGGVSCCLSCAVSLVTGARDHVPIEPRNYLFLPWLRAELAAASKAPGPKMVAAMPSGLQRRGH
jgi:hypothetical protein